MCRWRQEETHARRTSYPKGIVEPIVPSARKFVFVSSAQHDGMKWPCSYDETRIALISCISPHGMTAKICISIWSITILSLEYFSTILCILSALE